MREKERERDIYPEGFCMYGARLMGDRKGRQGLKAVTGSHALGYGVGGTSEIAASQSRHLS